MLHFASRGLYACILPLQFLTEAVFLSLLALSTEMWCWWWYGGWGWCRGDWRHSYWRGGGLWYWNITAEYSQKLWSNLNFHVLIEMAQNYLFALYAVWLIIPKLWYNYTNVFNNTCKYNLISLLIHGEYYCTYAIILNIILIVYFVVHCHMDL